MSTEANPISAEPKAKSRTRNRSINKLSATKVDKYKPKKPGRIGDGGGLWLQVSKWGTKAWTFHYVSPLTGRPRAMGLGSYPDITLEMAREEAVKYRRMVKGGLDPIEERKSERATRKAEHAKKLTFKQCAEAYIEAHKSGWKSAKHADQWRATLETYAYPTIGELWVADVHDSHIIKILQPIWTTKTETASRVRGRIEKILDMAKARKLRTGDNPAKWTGHLDQSFPRRSQVNPVENHPALPYQKLSAFMAELRGREGISARALEWTILNVSRTADTIGAKWIEIDLDKKVWVVPAARMKGKKGVVKHDHEVPLSDRALAILDDLPREADNPYVFIGDKAGEPISNASMAATIDRMNEDREKAKQPKWTDPKQDDREVVPHGFRSTFKDWCSDLTEYPNEMSEMALAHKVSDETEAAYRRGKMVEKRRRLMTDWAAFCDGQPLGDNVVPIRQASP